MNQISVLQSFTVVKTTTTSLQHYEANIVIISIISRVSLLCHKFILIFEGRDVLIRK